MREGGKGCAGGGGEEVARARGGRQCNRKGGGRGGGRRRRNFPHRNNYITAAAILVRTISVGTSGVDITSAGTILAEKDEGRNKSLASALGGKTNKQTTKSAYSTPGN